MVQSAEMSRRSRLAVLVERHTEHRLESVASLSIVVLGLYFILPFWGGNAFTRNGASAVAYAFMSGIAPEWAWGGWFLFCGLLARTGITTNSYRLRQLGMLMVVASRAFMLLSLGSQTGWQGGVLPEHLTWMVTSFLAYWGIDAK